MTFPRIEPLGDHAVRITLGDRIEEITHEQVQALLDGLEKHQFPGMVECIPTFTNVTLFYDPYIVYKNFFKGNVHGRELDGQSAFPYEQVAEHVRTVLNHVQNRSSQEPRLVEIPVCYGGEYGPDLEYVASYHGLTAEQVIDLHTSSTYLVYMIGFAPGFPYLGGMSELIATPRRATPRVSIPAGSVGIAGKQTGVYPLSTPGGWQIIGRTPVSLFQPTQNPPSFLQAGDRIRFCQISEYQLKQWQ